MPPQRGSICQIILPWGKLFWAQTSILAVGGELPHAGPCTQARGCPPPPACCILHFCCFEPTSCVALHPWLQQGCLCSSGSSVPGHPFLATPSGQGQSCDSHSLTPTQDAPHTEEGDSGQDLAPLPPTPFRDMTRQTRSQIPPESSHTHCSH